MISSKVDSIYAHHRTKESLGHTGIWIVQERDIRVLHSTRDDLDLVDIDAMTDVTEHYASIATQILEKL